MRSPFRRRRRRPPKRASGSVELESPDWPREGTGGGGLMSALRGDAGSGTGFGAGMFEDLHAAFSGGKQVQIEERESEKMRRHELHTEGAPTRDDLDSGTIKITRPRDKDQD